MQSLNFTPFPLMTTAQLVLRKLEDSDAAEIFIHRSDERILEYIDIPKAITIEDAKAFINKINKAIIENESIYWGISCKGNNTLIGTICLWNFSREDARAEIGYVLHPDFQGRGLMQEAIAAIIDYGFNTLQLHSIEADLHPLNNRSINVLERNGFTRVPDSAERDDGLIMYSLVKEVK